MKDRINNKKRRYSKTCFFKKNKVDYINYKEYEFLEKFMNINKKILTSKITGTSVKYQRKLSISIKRARHMALLPYSNKQLYKID